MRSLRTIQRFTPLSLLPFFLAACGGGSPDPPEEIEAAGILPAATADPAMFDSIAWETPQEAVRRGHTVYSYSCARCHGDRGAGNGEAVRLGRSPRPASMREVDWPYGGDLAGLRRAINSGTEKGMPHWGEAGLPPRDVDAVAWYILHGIRADLD